MGEKWNSLEVHQSASNNSKETSKKERAKKIIDTITANPDGIIFSSANERLELYELVCQDPSFLGDDEDGQSLSTESGLKRNDVLMSELVRKFSTRKIPGPEVALPKKETIESLQNILLVGAYEPNSMPVGRFSAPPFGLVRMASFLKNFGIDAQIYDVTKDGPDSLMKLVSRKKFDYIGMSVLGSTILNDISIVQQLKEFSPESKIIVGGQSATARVDLMQKSSADLVCLGYGEYPMLDLIYSKGEKQDIPGILRRTDDGSFQGPSAQSVTADDLATFSSTYDPDIMPLGEYWDQNRSAYSTGVETARIFTQTYCNRNCNFCSSKNFLKIAARMPDQSQCAELDPKSFYNFVRRVIGTSQRIKNVFINDDNFFQDSKRMRKIVECIQEGIEKGEFSDDVNFICSGRVDTFTSEVAELCQHMNATRVNFGVESFDDEALASLNKGVKKERIDQALDLCLDKGINPSINLLIFYPEVQLSQLITTIRKSIELYRKSDFGVEINIATYIRAYFGADILETDYPKEVRTKLVGTDHGLQQIEAESRVLPNSRTMRDFAKRSTEIKSSLEEEAKRAHRWQHLRAPKEVVVLILFKSILLTAKEFGLDQNHLYEEDVIVIDSFIEEIFAREKSARKEHEVDEKIEQELIVFSDANNMNLDSIDVSHKKEILNKLRAAKARGVLDNNNEIIAELVNFQKDLFNELWDKVPDCKLYLQILFHNYEKTRFWQLEKFQQHLLMCFMLQSLEREGRQVSKELLEIFGFFIEEVKKELIPILDHYLAQDQIEIIEDPDLDPKATSDQLRIIFQSVKIYVERAAHA